MPRNLSRLYPIAVIIALLFSFLPSPSLVQAAATELFFSEYVEGTSNNKALEIYNGTGADIDLAAGGYNVQMYFNGSTSAGLTISLTGVVPAGDVFVLAHSSAAVEILAVANQTNGAGWFNGDDAVILRKGAQVIDSIGQIGFRPSGEWGSGLTSTADNTLRRKSDICAGDSNPDDVFDPAQEWDGYATNTFDGLGFHTTDCSSVVEDEAPFIVAVSPADGTENVALDADIIITFSEPVDVLGNWFEISCGLSGSPVVTVSGGPTAFILTPETDFVYSETCTVNIFALAVSDQDLLDPPDNMLADFSFTFSTQGDVCTMTYIPAYAIQGSGMSAAITGVVTTQGVVIGDFEGPSPALRGFYIQDLIGDGDPATSDGIFVFNGTADSVNLGDLVRVTGTAGEFQNQTQISNVTSITHCGTAWIEPVDITLPFASPDYLERYEGMLVRLPQTLTVTEHFQLGRFGQVVLSSGGRLFQPTHLVSPGSPALDVQASNNLNRIILDDHLNNQNPDPILFARGGLPLSAENTLRGGDTVTSIVGVLTYTWGGNAASPNAYRVRPVGSLDGGIPDFQPTNPRPESPEPVGGTLKVAAFNLLNYFNTFGSNNCTLGVGGGSTGCRGADNLVEFNRQWPKTVAAILGTGADVIGVIEIENDGYGPDSAIADLVDRLNTATAPGTFAFIDVDAGIGQVNALGTDAIKVGFIYRTASVMPVGVTAVLNTPEFVTGGDSSDRNRPSLTQAFEQAGTGARFVVNVNHLKSKGGACDVPDAGDGQGNCNLVRKQAAELLAAWLASDPTGIGDPDILILGDLNAYAQEDPVSALLAGGFVNLNDAFGGAQAYSYVFNGQWGYLDYALASPSLFAQVTGVTEWHINADEPIVLDYNTNFKSAGQIASLYSPDAFRASDHDPIIVGLDLDGTPPQVDIQLSSEVLWPANHKYVTVTAWVTVTDDRDPNPSLQLLSVTSNEPDNGLGDGDMPDDILILDDFTFLLRAERSGFGTGRIYTITYLAWDAYGNTTVQSAYVTVPRDRRR